MKNIDVSFVMTVYNKEYYLPSVLRALLSQSGLSNPEFIFVDDVSTDKSVQIIRDMTAGLDNITIITNDYNRGISARINQGIDVAKGKWIRMLDSDDILPINSTEKMVVLADKLRVDIVYGQFIKTNEEPWMLEKRYIESFDYKYSSNALQGILTGRFTRMGQLIKTSVLKAAGGADERAFIQDESIPLRAAIHANGAVKISANVVLVPKEYGNFSGNKIQLDHDRFMAYYWTIKDNPKLPKKAISIMYQRAVSAYWKYIKKTKKLPYFSKCFIVYLSSKTSTPKINIKYLDKLYKDFSNLPNIRKIVP